MAHSYRTIAEGTDLWAFLEEGTVTKTYRPLASQMGCSLSDDSDQLESTAKNVGSFANYQYGRERWSASVEMLIPSDTDTNEVDFAELKLMKKAKYKPTIMFAFVDVDGVIDTTRPAYRGVVLIKTPMEAPDGELAKCSLPMQGCLELENLEYSGAAWAKVSSTYPPVVT